MPMEYTNPIIYNLTHIYDTYIYIHLLKYILTYSYIHTYMSYVLIHLK